MNVLLKTTLIFFFLASSECFSAESPAFKIVCELGGEHGRDSDRIEPSREIKLLAHAYAWVYPQLPQHLQQTALESVAVINHKNVQLTKTFSGWSAEDDPEYRYPDQKFYPQGTIKTNYTERFLRMLDWGERAAAINSNVALAVRRYAAAVIAHELIHAWQYHQKPVRDLNSVENSCPQGLCDEHLIEETKIKVAYEKAAYEAEKPLYFSQDALIIAQTLQNHQDQFPEDFAPGKPFYIFTAAGGKTDWVQRFFKEAESLKIGDAFAANQLTYEGQYVPAENVRKLVDINELAAHYCDLEVFMALGPAVENIKTQTEPFFNGSDNSKALQNAFPYVSSVQERYRAELTRFSNLFNVACP